MTWIGSEPKPLEIEITIWLIPIGIHIGPQLGPSRSSHFVDREGMGQAFYSSPYLPHSPVYDSPSVTVQTMEKYIVCWLIQTFYCFFLHLNSSRKRSEAGMRILPHSIVLPICKLESTQRSELQNNFKPFILLDFLKTRRLD